MSRHTRAVWTILFLALVALAVWFAHPFLLGAAWGAILAIMIFPLFATVADHHRLRLAFAVSTGFLLLVLTFMGVAAHELIEAAKVLVPLWQKEAAGHWPVPDFLERLPWFRSQFITGWDRLTDSVSHPLNNWPAKVPYFLNLLRGAGGILADILVATFVFFFLLKDGRDAEVLLKGSRWLHPLIESTLRAGVNTLRAITWSVLMAVIGEVMAFWALFVIAGLPHPFIIGMFLALISIIPIAGTIAMISIGGYLIIISHQWIAAILVTIIGLVILGFADNFGKPVLARMVDPVGDTPSIFWIIVGMITGVSTIGVIGVFLGPALFAMLMHVLNQLKPAGALSNVDAAQP